MGTSFNYDEMTAPIRQKDGTSIEPTTMARIADVVLKQTDKLIGKLGNPIGIKSYKPFHVAGDDSCRIIWHDRFADGYTSRFSERPTSGAADCPGGSSSGAT